MPGEWIDYLVERNAELQRMVAEARDWKWSRYFHDCLPGCVPDSLDPADHVPLAPDQGPTCRVLYRKALRWMRAGATYPERGFIAANRIGKCTTLSSYIDTPDGKRSMRDLLAAGVPFQVLAWDGARVVVAQASAPFKKEGLHECYRITMADGQQIECADEHLVLTSAGFLPTAVLQQQFDAGRLASSAAGCPSVPPAGDRRWTERLRDSLAHCGFGAGRGDGPLLWAAAAVGAALPSPGDVRGHTQPWWRADGRGNTDRRTHRERFGRLSSLGVGLRSAGLFAASASQSDSTSVGPWSGRFPGGLRSLLGFAARLRSSAARARPAQGTGLDGRLSAWCLASNAIVSIEPIGLQEVYDFEVDTFHNYVAADLIHHNTDTAAFEVTCHLTGRYPPWWQGRRWARPTDWRAAGDTMLTTRDILQKALLGPHEGVPVREWRGMLPPSLVVEVTRRSGGITNTVDTIHVRHISGAISRLSFLSYDMGRRVFQGFECDGFWIDEEPPDASERAEATAAGSGDIYGECLLRTMTTNGSVLATFTPLRGWTHFMRGYFAAAMMPGTEEDEVDVPAQTAVTSTLEGAAAEAEDFDVQSDQVVVAAAENPFGVVQPRFIIGATWDDAPHLTAQVKAQQWASMLPYQRAARTKGIPQLGAGAVYPIDEADLRVPDFAIPEHWWRGFGMDVGGGAKPTAAVFAALNPDDRVLYVTSVYKRASNEPSLHAAAIKERMMRPTGWLWPGVGDAAALIMTDHDAEQLVYVYRRLGLKLFLPDKAVETGIADVWDLMVTGRLKVFGSCQAWWDEFRMYRRDARGRVVKSNDHLMDSLRYLCRSGIARMTRRPTKAEDQTGKVVMFDRNAVNLGWMGS